MIASDENRKSILKNALNDSGISVSEEMIGQLLFFHDLLVEKNKVMNLTAITDLEEAAWKHYADSLAILKFIDLKNTETMLDVGSGAGLPGIPLKISCPWVRVVLLDSVGKKVNFHQEVFEKMGLKGIISVHARSEDAAHTAWMREGFDLVTARAVSNLTTLAEYCLPFVKEGGIFAAYKAETAESEIKEAEKALKILGGSVEAVENYRIGENNRNLIQIRKIHPTPKKYPRKAGVPLKMPIR